MPYLTLFLAVFVISCNGQNQSESKNTEINTSKSYVVTPENGFNCGLLDSKGIMWFGSNGGGVYRYDGQSFTHFTTVNGLSNNEVRAIIEDTEGNLWFGTGNGLCKYANETFTHIPLPFSDTSSIWLDKVYKILNPNAVHSLYQDKYNDIWIGTGGAGAYRYDGKTFTSYLTEIGHKQIDSLHHNWITSIVGDMDGNIWFSSMTRGGTSRFDGEIFTHFMPKDGLNSDMVRTIFTDKSGKVWFGYKMKENGGLTYYENKKFVTLDEKDGLYNSSMMTIYEDKKGNLWLGGNLGNIRIYNRETFTDFQTKEGKTFYGIIDILEDADENIWFLGDGLYRFDGETVTDMTRRNN